MKRERYLFEPKPRMEMSELAACFATAVFIFVLLAVALNSLAIQQNNDNKRYKLMQKYEEVNP